MQGRRVAIWALAVSQTLGYACLYYIFAALVVQWNADLGWSKTTLALGPTLAIVVSGALAPFLGRRVDRGQSRILLTAGPLVGGVGLVVLALTQTQAQYLVAWALIGAAQAMTLYEVCFAFLIRRLGADARKAIIRVTLVAGFASTLAFPAAAVMSEAWGWRGAVWVAVAVVVLVQMPLNYWAASVIRRGQIVQTKAEDDADNAALRGGLRSLRFWVLGGLTALLALNHWMMIALIIPVFTDIGVTNATAVLAASVIGPAQVLGRLALMRLDATMGNWQTLAVCLSGMGAAMAVLWSAGAVPMMIFAYAGLQGAAMGVMTILKPVLIAQVMGQRGYGAIAGSLQVMPLMAGAAAPLVGAATFGAGGAPALIALSAVLLTFAACAAVWLRGLSQV